MNEFETFKEISVGGLKKEELINQLNEKGIQFNKYAEALFEHPSFSPGDKVEKLRLVKLKLSDLRLTNPCSLQRVIENASVLGLKICPLYLAAFLRLQYLDQPVGPYLTIASTVPESDEDYPTGFYVRKIDNLLWLRGYRASGDCEWPVENEFIFLK